MNNCYNCGIPYNDSFVDWTICRDCANTQEIESGRQIVYRDILGISWTQKELDDAGGLQEVIRLNKEASI